VYNEEENVKPLHQDIVAVLKPLKRSFEIIFVDDCSTDRTEEILRTLNPVKVIRFRRQFGQSCALDAGIKNSKGNIIITLDGDRQNDPKDIPLLLETLEQGYDAVCGWRFKRNDPFLKKFISKGAKYLRRWLVQDSINDAGCTFRAYRRECFDDLDLYAEMHRMIPAMLKWRGFKITDVKVTHHPRTAGVTKYNWSRVFKGFMDMIYIWFWRSYAQRPMHLIGGFGIFFLLGGSALLAGLFVARLFLGYQLANKIWPLVGFVCLIIGIQLMLMGLMAANAVSTDRQKKYYIESVEEHV
jgi:glycosyltransferase involved in cell wall biosynthesis